MIPKIIHYCWFGGNPLPPLAIKCIKSWKKYCPDFEIIRWDESNYDISSSPIYVQQAFAAKKWAFVSDYVRLDVVYQHGGIYLDVDVQVIKSFQPLLELNAFAGIESDSAGVYVATGLGFGGEKTNKAIGLMRDRYKDTVFILPDGSMNLKSCPKYNTEALDAIGFIRKDEKQVLPDITIFPNEYFNPMSFDDHTITKTENTFSIHRYSASWMDGEKRSSFARLAKKRRRKKQKEYLQKAPNRFMRKLLGDNIYEKLKLMIKKKSPR